MFEKISNIKVEEKSTWDQKIFITMDMDWCNDEVLSFTLDIIDEYQFNVTFFVTHETKLLQRMRKNDNIELGIHPNFNPLLNGNFYYGENINEVISYYKTIVPEAVSVRSHSMTQSSPILETFVKHGLKYDCNSFVPHSSNIELKPYAHWSKELIKVPYFWEDDVHCLYNWEWNISKFLDAAGLKVFDFHPIHIFLNSEKISRYENAKPLLNNFEELKKNINDKNFGSKNFLIDLLGSNK